ncbi:hypothetical protein ACFOZ0_35180 [Streptomyces yaanensis]|uniref:Extensin n=1 Tax=Streptomyces yaanensis TaxID=1142239 RepID=A0ABV7SQP6_9ACTN|nr:hypothetical protein [Streptomyces sp. CGMCC 4.7035]WNB97363.1 hypothetical protein Q2K21_04345 [Streptomyces sp. CGMCC 4.7035]
MADEQYKWLDGDAAERLLRGEPLDAVDADTRARADQLAEALAALAATPPPASVELPGEAAALAAFRAARTGGDGAEAVSGRSARPHAAAQSADAGLVRLGRPVAGRRRARWARPLRFGLAAAVAAGMIGGVAVAAGTGVLPTPFHDEPGLPAASVSAPASPRHPLLTPPPSTSGTGGSPALTPGTPTGAPAQGGPSRDEASGDSAATGRPGSGKRATGRTDTWWSEVRSSCRDMASGKGLEAGRLRTLEDAAGGSGRVASFCKGVLGNGEDRQGTGGHQGSGQDENGTGQNGSGSGSGEGDQSGDQGGNGGDGEGHIWPQGLAATSSATPRLLAPALPEGTMSPGPTYSVLSTPEGP